MTRIADSAASKDRLRRLLGLFFVALAIPSAVLVWQAHSRLKWESFHQYQRSAGELLGRIDRQLRAAIAKEEARAFTDYRFLAVQGDPTASYLQRSPLAALPVSSDVPGLIGYFQVDADGRFSTPLLPDDPGPSPLAYGIDAAELETRRALRARLLAVLGQEGRLVGQGPREAQPKKEASGPAAQPVPSTEAAPVASRDQTITEDIAPPSAASRQALESALAEPEARTELRERKLAQAAFDRLSKQDSNEYGSKGPASVAGKLGRVDQLQLDQAFDDDRAVVQARRPLPRFEERVELDVARDAEQIKAKAAARSSRSPVPTSAQVPESESQGDRPTAPRALVRLLESEVDPFEFGLLGGDYFVLYRKAWRAGQRHIQGAVIERAALLRGLVEEPFRDTALAGMSRLGIAFDDEILSALGGQQGRGYLSSAEELSGTLLHRGRLSSPLNRLELIFSVTQLPAGPAGALLVWVALTLGLVLSGGLFLLYRLGVKQIELSSQQRDFVSAISHELKTPLTSIRMYSEMLRKGWTDEARRRSYYDFIHDESERLSRLIENVLQLARISRDKFRVELHPVTVGQLLDNVHSKVVTQVEQAGFELRLACDDVVSSQCVAVDEDAFAQIMINLVDNAIKFSAQAEQRSITLRAEFAGDDRVVFAIRDHGPGIPRDQLKKIFRLFYRSENELTRETLGTGIGLALVHRLVNAMGGEVDVVNSEPGAEFRIRLAVARGHSVG